MRYSDTIGIAGGSHGTNGQPPRNRSLSLAVDAQNRLEPWPVRAAYSGRNVRAAAAACAAGASLQRRINRGARAAQGNLPIQVEYKVLLLLFGGPKDKQGAMLLVILLLRS